MGIVKGFRFVFLWLSPSKTLSMVCLSTLSLTLIKLAVAVSAKCQFYCATYLDKADGGKGSSENDKEGDCLSD